MNFENWLNTFIDEKGINRDRILEVESNDPIFGDLHLIPVEVVLEHMLIAPAHEQAKIKDILVQIDFANGDVYHFLNHLAGAIAC